MTDRDPLLAASESAPSGNGPSQVCAEGAVSGALKVGPGEVLILRVPEVWARNWSDQPVPSMLEQLLESLETLGLNGRVLVITADPGDVEMASIARSESHAG